MISPLGKFACISIFTIAFGAGPGGALAQPASSGPYEYLPFGDGYIVEAFMDLLPSTSARADWTGWSGSTWVSPNAYNNHDGTDWSMATGTPIYAATTGTITEVERTIPANTFPAGGDFGNFVKIRADGLSPKGEIIAVKAAHLLPENQTGLPTISVTVGQQVNAGQHIGYSDNTGNSTSEHCHVQSSIVSGDVFTCPFYHGHFKYPIMFSPNGKVQVGHIVKVRTTSTPIRNERFEDSTIIGIARKDQMYFASFDKRGYWRIFIPNNPGNRSGWVRALDVDEVLTGTVIQPLPDTGPYVHTAQLNTIYPIRATADTTSTIIGYVLFAGGRFVADQQAPGNWYRIPIPVPTHVLPGPRPDWGWVQADSKMVVYPQLYNAAVNLAALPSNEFPITENFDSLGLLDFGKPKFVRCQVVNSSPASPGGDGKVLKLTDATNTGDGAYETVRVGRPEHRDYFVEADVYLNYNPSYGTWERYGIFLRDDGFAGWDQTFEGAGNCYAMTWDSDDGWLRCAKIIDGAGGPLNSPVDFALPKINITTSGWYTMRIEAQGDSIRYYLNGDLKASVTDTTFISGRCGMGYTSNVGGFPAQRGAHFDNFSADVIPGTAVKDWALY